jgi:3',5'-cyclic AMP phosphodiesterase CpdA
MAFAVFAVSPGVTGDSEEGGFTPFRFSVLGDTRPHGNPEKIIQPPMFKKAIQEINLLGTDFTVDVGDLILGYEDDAQLIHQEWDEYFRTCEGFDNPYYSVVGNHDVWDKQSEEIWLKRLGPLYYGFSHKGCRFICLHSEDPDSIDHINSEQLKWLKSELESHSDAKHIFVFLHKPLWHSKFYPEGTTNWMKDVHPLLAQYNVNTVFAGHIHVYELSEEMDGIRYVITGGGGAEIQNIPYRGDFHHHCVVDVNGDDVRIAVVKTNSIFPEDVVTRKQVELVDMFLKHASPAPVSIVPGNPAPMTATVIPRNPFDDEIEIGYVLEPVEESGWSCDEARREVTLQPGDSTSVSFALMYDGHTLFPLPQAHVTCSLNGETILEQQEPLNFELERALRIKKLHETIEIDGNLEEKVWKEAEPSGRWMNIDKTGWARDDTEWLALYDSDNLYFAFHCWEDDIEKVQQVSRERDWQMLNDDCVIIYLDPVRDGESRYCFGSNAGGVTMDYKAPGGKVDFSWNPDWECRAVRGETGYSLEIAIPFDILDTPLPESGTRWHVNAFRMCTPEPRELDGWNLPVERLSNPAGYGRAVFE